MAKIHIPIGLLLDDHSKCVVVGAGKVGTRKVLNLLDMGCQNIVIIAPEITESLSDVIQANNLTHIQNDFEPNMLQDARLVFACTHLVDVNNNIITEARKIGALALRTDNAWNEGDFISMATIKQDRLMLSVSTSGRSCRKSRHIKDYLAQQIAHLNDISPFVIGIDQRLTQMEKRESYVISSTDELKMGEMFKQLRGIHSFMLLNTCNRIELIGIGGVNPSTLECIRHILGFKENYFLSGKDAVEHLALTTAGLYAQVPVEKHITSQIKTAFANAQKRSWSNKTLEEWINITLNLSRSIRAKIEPHFKAIEMEELLYKMLLKRHPNAIMILGTGEVGKAVKSQLKKINCQLYWGYHSKKPRIENTENLTLFNLSDMQTFLPKVDVIIGALKSDKQILPLDYQNVINNNCLLIDLGLPRNFDPECKNHFQLMNLDDIKHWYRKHLNQIDALIPLAKSVILDEKSYYEKWLQSLSMEHI